METIVEYVFPSLITTPYINFLEWNGKKIKTYKDTKKQFIEIWRCIHYTCVMMPQTCVFLMFNVFIIASIWLNSYFIWWETKCWGSNNRVHWGCTFGLKHIFYSNAMLHLEPNLSVFSTLHQSSSSPTNFPPSITMYTLECNVH